MSQCEKEVDGDTGDQRWKQDKGTHGDGDECEIREARESRRGPAMGVHGKGRSGKIQGRSSDWYGVWCSGVSEGDKGERSRMEGGGQLGV